MKQITLIDLFPVREPCGMTCDVEWGSLQCMEKNGYIFDRNLRKFLRREDGSLLIGRRECTWRQ